MIILLSIRIKSNQIMTSYNLLIIPSTTNIQYLINNKFHNFIEKIFLILK